MMWKNLANKKSGWLLLGIVVLAGVLRIYGINWDQGGHMHPDERAIVMAVDTLHWPDNLNPKFFAYGNLPFYLLWVAGNTASYINASYGQYVGINLVGRLVSALFELGSVVVVYLLGRKLDNERLGLWSAFFYASSVLPIQLAHFYAVDTLLTFFILGAIYQLVCFVKTSYHRHLIWFGVLWGLALATKISAVVLVVPLIVALVGRFYKSIPKLVFWGGVTVVLAGVVFVVCEPYAVLDFATFRIQMTEQQAMTRDAWVFPYTLQYVGKIPYWYEFKNIYLWGAGPVLATLSIVGMGLLGFTCFKRKQLALLVVLAFAGFYFGIVGKFAVGFIRYMLPIYPILCLGAGYFVSKLKGSLGVIIAVLVLVWPLSFVNIYAHPNARTTASQWIYNTIPAGAKIAREHWDDGLPGGGPNIYTYLELPMYDPDTPQKWAKINNVLVSADYIVIASNRLYVPLMKLTDCAKFPVGHCYRQTAQYYQDLFSGKLGYRMIAQFWVLPKIPFTNLEINDFTADENFTVFDHPKIMIFKNDHKNS